MVTLPVDQSHETTLPGFTLDKSLRQISVCSLLTVETSRVSYAYKNLTVSFETEKYKTIYVKVRKSV